MKVIGIRQTLLAAGMILGASCCACSHHASANHAALKAKPDAEQSFQLIVETFKRRVEETPVGFVASDPSRRTTMVGANKVSSELIHPTNTSDPLKAVITVASQSRYSIKRMKDKEKDDTDNKSDDSNAKTRDDRSTATDPKKGTEAFDPALISKAGPIIKNPGSDDVIARRPDEEVRKYELLYQNGRWTLVTELNKDTEQAIQFAFKTALETQI